MTLLNFSITFNAYNVINVSCLHKNKHHKRATIGKFALVPSSNDAAIPVQLITITNSSSKHLCNKSLNYLMFKANEL